MANSNAGSGGSELAATGSQRAATDADWAGTHLPARWLCPDGNRRLPIGKRDRAGTKNKTIKAEVKSGSLRKSFQNTLTLPSLDRNSEEFSPRYQAGFLGRFLSGSCGNAGRKTSGRHVWDCSCRCKNNAVASVGQGKTTIDCIFLRLHGTRSDNPTPMAVQNPKRRAAGGVSGQGVVVVRRDSRFPLP